MIGNVYLKDLSSTIILLVFFILLNILLTKLTRKYAKASHLSDARTNLISKYIGILLFILFCAGCVAIWGVESKQIFSFLGATLTVVSIIPIKKEDKEFYD